MLRNRSASLYPFTAAYQTLGVDTFGPTRVGPRGSLPSEVMDDVTGAVFFELDKSLSPSHPLGCSPDRVPGWLSYPRLPAQGGHRADLPTMFGAHHSQLERIWVEFEDLDSSWKQAELAGSATRKPWKRCSRWYATARPFTARAIAPVPSIAVRHPPLSPGA